MTGEPHIPVVGFIDTDYETAARDAVAPDLRRTTKAELWEQIIAERKTLADCNEALKTALCAGGAAQVKDLKIALAASRAFIEVLGRANGELRNECAELRVSHDCRVNELLAANTRYVEQAREARRLARRNTFDRVTNQLLHAWTFGLLILGFYVGGLMLNHYVFHICP